MRSTFTRSSSRGLSAISSAPASPILVHAIRARSQEAADKFNEPIELIFVDGSHEEALVREDFEKWVPKVAGKAP